MNAIDKVYYALCAVDKGRLLPQLSALAQQCRHVTVLGFSDGMDVIALLHGLYHTHDLGETPLTMNVINSPRHDQWFSSSMTRMAQREGIQVTVQDIPLKTDLLYIHDLSTLQETLPKVCESVNHYIVVYGTEQNIGVKDILEQFLNLHPEFMIHEHFFDTPGLTSLRRVL